MRWLAQVKTVKDWDSEWRGTMKSYVRGLIRPTGNKENSHSYRPEGCRNYQEKGAVEGMVILAILALLAAFKLAGW